MLDEPRSNMSAAEKLELLTSHAGAWQRFHAVRPEYAASLVGWNGPVAESGNILVFIRGCDGSKGECSPGADVAIDHHLDVLVVRVGSAHRRTEGAQWMLYLPAHATLMGIDASQDLLIYPLCVPSVPLHVSHRVLLIDPSLGRGPTLRVRSLSTGAVHPSVVGHSGSFKLWQDNDNWTNVFTLRVCGDYVAGETRMFYTTIWNWKTGALVFDQVEYTKYLVILAKYKLMFIHYFRRWRTCRSSFSTNIISYVGPQKTLYMYTISVRRCKK